MKIKLGVVAALAIALVGFAAPAQATRTTAEAPDLCSNLAGHQGADGLLYGYWRYKVRTAEKGDCRRTDGRTKI